MTHKANAFTLACVVSTLLRFTRETKFAIIVLLKSTKKEVNEQMNNDDMIELSDDSEIIETDANIKKEIANAKIEFAIYKEDILRYPYKVRKSAYANYEQLLLKLSELRDKGKCTFVCDDLNKAYDLHTVYVTWLDTQDNCFIEFSATEIAELLSLSDTFCICVEEEVDKWQLSTQIYFKN